MHYQFYNSVVTIAIRLLASRATLEPTQPPIQWVPGSFPEDRAAVA